MSVSSFFLQILVRLPADPLVGLLVCGDPLILDDPLVDLFELREANDRRLRSTLSASVRCMLGYGNPCSRRVCPVELSECERANRIMANARNDDDIRDDADKVCPASGKIVRAIDEAKD